MSLLTGITRRSVDPVQQALSERRLIGTYAGMPVTPDTAMRHSAVWASVGLIADNISVLPVGEFTQQGARFVSVGPDKTSPLLVAPSAEVGLEDWLRQILVSCLLRGNAWGVITDRDKRLRPTQIDIVHPDNVTWSQRRRMEPLAFKVNGEPIDTPDLFHMPAYVIPGSPIGLSPIGYARQGIGLGLAAEQFGGDWFANGAHPSGVLSSELKIDEPEARVIKRRFIRAQRRREPAVLGKGMKWEQIQIAPDESQFLDTIEANVATIARYFGVPPEMIASKSGDSQTYANVESRALHLLTFCFNQWIVRLEKCLGRLIKPGDYVKFNVDALARVNLKTRYEAHQLAIRNGWKNRDEIRELEELGPIEDGDLYLWPPYAQGEVGQTEPKTE